MLLGFASLPLMGSSYRLSSLKHLQTLSNELLTINLGDGR